ncbi:velvet factor-domain-containing protein [Aspergillus aurantiobrunneus]
MAARAPPPAPINETDHSVSRITREGKKITYQLNVMQQPERARACGAGAKSSSDRRPVDPPPVVEMRIFESDPHDDSHRTDITFAYNANFFLFATLETARPMAQGRLASTPNLPVLTGVPVAGVAYLDRPSQAGYFIFPDLSVRHEGVYRLSFHLFEQTKDAKDATEGTQLMPPPAPGKLSAPQQFLDFRLEVVSVPFTVYSAKKFPGLTTSTNLSRVIAEQGCRVRIRRDVRMRRRGDKRADDYDYDDDRVFSSRRADRYATPDAYANPPERPRSTSISTIDNPYTYSQRRSSGAEYGAPTPQTYQRPMPPTPAPPATPIPPITASAPAAVPPSTPSPASAHAPTLPSAPVAAPPPLHAPVYQSHLSFGSTQTQYPAPQLSHVPQPTATPTNMYSPRPSMSHGRNPPAGTEYEPSMSYPYSHPRLPAERPSYSKPLPTTALPPLRLPNSHSMQPGESHHPHEASGIPRSQAPSNMVTSLPPIQTLPEFPPASSQPSSSIGSSPGNEYGPVKGLWETNQTLSKRTHEETFGHEERPLYNGMRPDSEAYPGGMQRRPSYDRASLLGGFDQMAYKRANGRMMSSAPATQTADRSVDIDSSDADHQLQHSLKSTCRSHNSTGHHLSRKHKSNGSRSSIESDFLSEVSGQFDDAEEPGSPFTENKGITAAAADGDCSPSSHSVKRRRSNDWPRQPGDIDNDPASRGEQQIPAGSRPQRWFGHYYGRHANSKNGSPRSPRHGRPGRRSRFVEGYMNDTVSQKPPSILFPDEARNNETSRGATRQSGIFRFGKAIASVFNPFGGWGSVSDIWKSPQIHEGSKEPADDRLRQAEMAYEELKRSGYQGTAKGSYVQSLGTADAVTSLPEETWRSIQEKMNYGDGDTGGGQHSRQSSGQASNTHDSVSGISLRPSLPGLRKAKSSLAVPSIKKTDGMSSLLQHIDSRGGHGQEVRHQKSRKELQKQAKLLKRVSNLEEKLERARRELRELSGKEEQLMRASLNEEKPYQRKFVPGALPSLPSERLLHDPEPTTPLTPTATGALQAPEPEGRIQSQIRVNKTRLKSPKPWRSASQARSSSAHSLSSRKRKSPDPESRKKPDPSNHQQPPAPDLQSQENQTPDPSGPEQPPAAEEEVTKTPPSRKAKLPKTARGDSPGSVERKQKQKRSPAGENSTSPGDEQRASRPLRSTTRNSSATPVLRMKRGRGDLRSTTYPGHGPGLDEDKENHHAEGDNNHDAGHGGPNDKLEQQQDLQADQRNTPTPTPSGRKAKARYEYIPPVPPLPKDLAATAAKVDRRLAREMGKRRSQREKDGKSAEGFQWPEDIF